MPTVSVIVPTYNRSHLLQRAVGSVLAQTYSDWELIVVNDGSVDGTDDLMRSFCQRERRIRYLTELNSGDAMARNRALQHATGRYVAFLDDDDEWLPEKLAVQTAFMEAHPTIGLTYTYAAGRRLKDGTPDPSTLYGRPVCNPMEDLLNWPNFISMSTIMLRRDCLEETGYFNSDYNLCGDYELQLRFAQCWPLASIEKILTIHGQRDGRPQLTNDGIENQLSAIRVLRNFKLKSLYRSLRRRKQRHIARIHYNVGRDYVDREQYGSAARHFAAAIAMDPWVGLMVRRKGERGMQLVARIAKAYLAVPACLWRSL